MAGDPGFGPAAGGGGTQTAGGAAGAGNATAGSFGFGGLGQDIAPVSSGGGGGGWYGGGGGGIGGNGGGGSGHISPLALSGTLTTGVWSAGDGKVVIYKA